MMSVSNIIIRACNEPDLAAVGDIFREFVRYHASFDPCFVKVPEHAELFIEFMAQNMRDDKSRVLVADAGNRVVGYCLGRIMKKPPVYESPEYGYIDNTAVLEEYQRMGIGERLFSEMKVWFTSRGVLRVELFAAVKNPKSTSFWKKLGFTTYLEQMYLHTSHD
jgi:ribosomal protein S18 acetylase RimI-like enzyme